MVVFSATEFQNLHDLDTLKPEINRLSSEVFNNINITDTVGMVMNTGGYIGFLKKDNQIVACGFGVNDNNKSSTKYNPMYIHNFGVHKDYRGQGLCQKIVSEFIKRFGKAHILYLTVRTELGNVNESAIRCYEKKGFIMLSEVYRDNYDGKNNAMIRLPTMSKNSIRTRRMRKTKKIKKK